MKLQAKEISIQFIFGWKLKQLRVQRNWSLQQLSDASGLSVSYLNEIEKGKKYPKAPKILALAKALETPYDQLISLQVDKTLAPAVEVMNSDILDEIPLDLFGIDSAKLLEMLVAAPAKVNAFLSTLIQIARSYQFNTEHFYYAALRAYQELHSNYFEDLEDSVSRFCKSFKLKAGKVDNETLSNILIRQYRYTIVSDKSFPRNLNSLRSVFVAGANPVFFLNPELKNEQIQFQLLRELAFNFLNLNERTVTTTALKVNSFDEALNNFKASYFANAFLIPSDDLRAKLNGLFQETRWNQDSVTGLLKHYEVSAETFLYRLTSILPRFFGISSLFFLRFVDDAKGNEFILDKELHLSGIHKAHARGLQLHYCRRWVAIKVLRKIREKRKSVANPAPVIAIQRSSYLDSDQEYLVLSIARPVSSKNLNSSVTIGLQLNNELKKKIKFWNDKRIPAETVNEVCESCSLNPCRERACPPVLWERSRKQAQARKDLESFIAAQSGS